MPRFYTSERGSSRASIAHISTIETYIYSSFTVICCCCPTGSLFSLFVLPCSYRVSYLVSLLLYLLLLYPFRLPKFYLRQWHEFDDRA